MQGAAPLFAMSPMPVCLYIRDYFTVDFSHIPEIAIPVDDVWDVKLRACACHRSQVGDWLPWEQGILDEVRADPQRQQRFIYENTYGYTRKRPEIELTLTKWFGEARAEAITYVEAFEVAEFGRQVTDQELRELFPMLG